MRFTVALVKPDAFRRKLVGRILARIEENEFELRHMVGVNLTLWQAEAFYGLQHEKAPYFKDLCRFVCSGPVLAMSLEWCPVGALLDGDSLDADGKPDTVAAWRRLMGPTDPAGRSAKTIRGEMAAGFPIMENLVHGSDSERSFYHEFAEVVQWRPL